MAIRKIVLVPDPILKEKAKVVTKFNHRLHTLLDDMKETMYDAPGVGLAAPQIGISKRIIVLDDGEEFIEAVNPQIIDFEGEQMDPAEGCLSIPNLLGIVCRHTKVRIKAQNRQGDFFEVDAEDYLARIFQHEIDHLNGVLFTDIADRVFEPPQEGEE